MAHAIQHRGPDDSGVWIDESYGFGLAHRRLAIVDLSPAGHQPMVSQSGRFVIVFNGEIYNHFELRASLEARTGSLSWRGHSDTETLLAALDIWGIDATLKKIVGMFALAVWDRQERALSLIRDRMGEKPLYYGFAGNAFVFCSELNGLRAYPTFSPDVSREALAIYLRHSYIPAPFSIYSGIRKLIPGTKLRLNESDVLARRLPAPSPYWSVSEAVWAGKERPFTGTVIDAQTELEYLLSRAVSSQTMADVPVGALLSGGVDSSAVVALMQRQTTRPVNTFTIGFHEPEFNEANHARAVATYLGTEHTELYVTTEQAMEVIPRMGQLYDEPFADSSQIPTYLVSQLARQKVTVSLTGDGGDELFGGYNRHFWASRIWNKLVWMPPSVRAALAGVLTTASPGTWDGIFKGFRIFLPKNLRYANAGDKLHKLADVLAARSADDIYYALISHWKQPSDIVHGEINPHSVVSDHDALPASTTCEERMMYLDQVIYLPGDILHKVDRAAMGVSLETRVPFLDHRIVEFAWSLPLSMKVRQGQSKWLLRQVLYSVIPKALIERPKAGFALPLDRWLRGPLKAWADELIDPARLAREEFFLVEPIKKKWREHLSGRRNWTSQLWSVLMAQMWLKVNIAGGT